jgi:pimeloyl-ACP methyl ester carboxylesterase
VSADLTFALIHGDGLGPWVWDRLIPLLDHPAVALPRAPLGARLARLTLADCADFAWRQIEAAGHPCVILVAHAIGGVLAPEIARRLPGRVAHLVYVGAIIPPDGAAAIGLYPPRARLRLSLALRLAARGLHPPAALVDRRLRQTIYNDLDEATTGLVLKGGKNPEPPALFFERVSRDGLPPIPATYVKLLRDQGSLPPNRQDEMASNIGAPVFPLDAAHTPMLSRPRALATLLNGLAAEVHPPEPPPSPSPPA